MAWPARSSPYSLAVGKSKTSQLTGVIPAEQACPAAPRGQRQPSAPTPGGACPEARRPSVPLEELSLTLGPDTQDGAENWILTPRWAACFHMSGPSRAGAAIRLGSPPNRSKKKQRALGWEKRIRQVLSSNW